MKSTAHLLDKFNDETTPEAEKARFLMSLCAFLPLILPAGKLGENPAVVRWQLDFNHRNSPRPVPLFREKRFLVADDRTVVVQEWNNETWQEKLRIPISEMALERTVRDGAIPGLLVTSPS